MAGKDGYTVSRRAVPNSNGLVIGSRDLWDTIRCERNAGDRERSAYNPWHFVMKLNGTDIIQVSMQSKQTPPVLRSNILRQLSYSSPTNR